MCAGPANTSRTARRAPGAPASRTSSWCTWSFRWTTMVGLPARRCVARLPNMSAQFWLLTQFDRFGDLERWPAMATGEPEGEEIMHDLLSLAEGMTASVVAELDG